MKDSKLDSLIYPQKAKDTLTIQLVTQKSSNTSFIGEPLFISFIFPILIALLTSLISHYFFRKKNDAEIRKLEVETEKNQAELDKIKASNQPLILNSLQNIQNKLFQNKIDSLKELIKSKSEFFNVEQDYYEGNEILLDAYDYYKSIYDNFNYHSLNRVNSNSLENSNLFPSSIKEKFNFLVKLLYEVNDIKKREHSLMNDHMPDEAEEKIKIINKLFDELIDSIRVDLHFDNTFIHDFFKSNLK